MVDPKTTKRIAYRMLFVAMAAGILFLHLLPLSPGADRSPGPDLTLALTLVWVVRRPRYVPVLLIAAVFFLEDLLFLRPPGLWTLIVVLATEFLRSRETTLRQLPFISEWLIVGALMVVMLLANRLVLALVVVPQPTLEQTLLQMQATLIAYPLVALVSQVVFKLRRVPGDIDEAGLPL
ncbi:rod shape-determining protein MreD [Phaeovulum sp.]|uniref:rod shape-determining protein MreD n=1 Tax=Phaeovulum sp. TaxID=2934796 RepID=UPI0039E3F108